LVAQGFSQSKGLDYDETFSPVVRHSTVRVILALAAMNKWELKQLDVKNAFLHGDLKEEVYMAQPQGFVDSAHPDYVCLLKKSLYGLKQAPRAWNEKFTSFLPSLGFNPSHSDPSLFVKHSDHGLIVLLLYVDDIVITGSDTKGIHEVISELSSVFDMKDLGFLSYFLGIEVTKTKNGLFLSQTKYAKDLLIKTGMETIRSCSSPCLPHNQMTKDQGIPLADPTLYRSIVGALQYLTFTRPDIAYAVNTVCQFMSAPTDVHFAAVKRILRYLQGSIQKGLSYSSTGAVNNAVTIKAYCDADWAGEVIQRRSTTGFIVYLGMCPISWQSKKQGSVSRSSTESEYRSLANTAAEISWLRHILCDLKIRIPCAPLLKCDNLSALALASNPVFHSRIKHLDNDFHFVRERVQRNDLRLEYVSTTEQTADILTKGLPSPLFLSHCVNLRLTTLAEVEGG
jgi:histone deacetylase 1/2